QRPAHFDLRPGGRGQGRDPAARRIQGDRLVAVLIGPEGRPGRCRGDGPREVGRAVGGGGGRPHPPRRRRGPRLAGKRGAVGAAGGGACAGGEGCRPGVAAGGGGARGGGAGAAAKPGPPASPTRQEANSWANSSGVWKRRSGLLAISRRTTAATAGGTSGRS